MNGARLVLSKSQSSRQAYWFSELSVLLTTKDVEVVGRGARTAYRSAKCSCRYRRDRYSRSVNDLHVAILVLSVKLLRRGEDSRIIIGQLQESLETTRRVFRSLSIVTVRKGEYQSRSLEPFLFSGGDELVDDALGVVAVGINRVCQQVD